MPKDVFDNEEYRKDVKEVEYRLNTTMIEELVRRNEALEELVRLQETELATLELLMFAILITVGYNLWICTRRKVPSGQC